MNILAVLLWHEAGGVEPPPDSNAPGICSPVGEVGAVQQIVEYAADSGPIESDTSSGIKTDCIFRTSLIGLLAHI